MRCYNITPSTTSPIHPRASLQHQPPQHLPQRLSTLRPLLPQAILNPLNKPLRLPPQLINNAFRVLKAALAFHILQGIALDLLVCGFLLQDVDEDLVAGIGADGVDDGEREFAFCQVFAEPFERGVAGCGGEVEVVVEDLEE